MPERNEDPKPIDERAAQDQDDTTRYGKDFYQDPDAEVRRQDKSNLDRSFQSDDLGESGEPSSSGEVTEKNEFKPEGSRPIKQVSEKDLVMEVKRRLYDDGRVDASNIYVEIKRGGQARLWGAVASAEEKEVAESLARETPGVGEVSNELQIMQNKPLHTGGPQEQKRPE